MKNIALILFVVICTFFVTKNFTTKDQEVFTDKNYGLINPVVNSSLNKHFIVNFQPLRINLESIVKDYKGKAYVYFLYLNNAAWVGINERETFTAASTVKVPLAMTLYKFIEQKKFDVGDMYVLDEEDLNDGFGELYKEGVGSPHSLEDLVKIMLTNSDNTASNAIANLFKKNGIDAALDDVYDSMGWTSYVSIGEVENYGKMHLKVFSNMFLSLYNATYINPSHSQKILSYLVETPFNNKIVAGVPSSIKVAHKIGVYDSDKTYTDCGIIYAPHREYILCVASVGVPESDAISLIAKISKTTYDYVINN